MMDQQLLSAQSICASVNTSESARALMQSVYVEGKTIDSMQLYKLLNDLKRIKGASANMNIYNIVLAIAQDNRLFTGGTVISVQGECRLIEDQPYIGLSTVNELLGVSNASTIMLNKQYLIYADAFLPFSTTGSSRGTILVLLEQSAISALARDTLPAVTGGCILRGDQTLLSFGETDAHVFDAESMVQSGLTYREYANASAFIPPLSPALLAPVFACALLGLVFIACTYFFSKWYYRPIDNISHMIDPPEGGMQEMDDIISGISSLIGERNGYRERMVTITPYARQGVLHSLLNGSLSKPIEVLTDERFMGLRRAYFMLAVVNVTAPDASAQQLADAQTLIHHACREMGAEEYTVACYKKDVQNLFVIINADDDTQLEPLFYTVYDRCVDVLDDPRYAVTIGVSRAESSLEALCDACEDAEAALGQMLTGGRSSVYFFDAAQERQPRRYFFPKDAHRRFVRGLKEGDLAGMEDMLRELYQKNVREAELPVSELRLMLDELHVTIRNALREVYDVQTTHITMERIREAAPIEELFTYYHSVLTTALARPGGDEQAHESRSLSADITAHIEAHFCDPDLSLNALADRFGVSTKMIGLICKDAYGQTFLQHVRDLQIRRAAELLSDADASLESIAQQCGFANLLTFRRNFKAVMGMNPSDYRK